MPDDRYLEARSFLTAHAANFKNIRLIAGDASNRKYYRVDIGSETALVMDAPPDKGEQVRSFVNMATYLNAVGLSAPKIIAQDEQAGFLLIEDFGDAIFARLLERGQADEAELYTAATDVLLHLHAQAPPQIASYSTSEMADLAALACDWYQIGILGIQDGAKEQLRPAMAKVLAPLEVGKKVLAQRDFHSENLIWLPNRDSIRRVGLLDFQDAKQGHPAYDLVSFLQDARRDVPPELQKAMLARYISASGYEPASFRHAYHALGIQRNLRIVGVFARLCLRDGKPSYLKFIPRVWDHIMKDLSLLGESELTEIVSAHLPKPSPENLELLQSKCLTHRNL